MARTKLKGVARTASGRISRSREGLIASGRMVHTDYAVYFAECEGRVKIGFSGQLAGRMDTLGWEKGAPLEIMGLVYAPSEKLARALEKKMHERFAKKRLSGEWFSLGLSDILAALGDCRKLGLKTCGGEPADGRVHIMSGMVYGSDVRPA